MFCIKRSRSPLLCRCIQLPTQKSSLVFRKFGTGALRSSFVFSRSLLVSLFVMLGIMLCIIKFLLLLSLLKYEAHAIFARQMLLGRASVPFVTPILNTSTTSSLIQPYSNSLTFTSKISVDNHSQGTKLSTCAAEHNCSSKKKNGTVGSVNTTNTNDRCLLWDPSCSGNRTLAIDTFFDPTFQRELLSNRCFVQAESVNLGNVSNCDKYNPPGSLSEYQEVKSWMRSQQCVSAAAE